MAAIIDKYKKEVINLNKDLEQIKKQVISDNRAKIINHFQEYQIGLGLRKGVRKDGVIIGWYTKYTEEVSKDPERRPRNGIIKFHGDAYNMEWTGRFFDSMFIYYEDKYTFSISSTVPYLKDIMKTVKNQDIFSLTDNTSKEVQEMFINENFNKILSQRLSRILGA